MHKEHDRTDKASKADVLQLQGLILSSESSE